MNKILKFLVSVVMVSTLLVACGSTGIISTPDRAVQDSSSVDKHLSEKGIRIAIVSSPSGVDDGNFNEGIYKGIQEFIAKHPASEVTPIREMTGEADAAIETITDIIGDYDVIVCGGFQFAELAPIANNYPKKNFILVDTHPLDNKGKEVKCSNVYAMEFKDQESGFLAGMAAALESKTKKVAVVTGMPFPSNVNYQYGFESGVNYANEKYYTGVETVEISGYSGVDIRGMNVGGNYIGSFSDTDKGKAIGKELLAKGCDIIFAAAGGAGRGVFDAVKEAEDTKEIKVIGCDVDQYDDGRNGNHNVVLTSALKVMHTNVEKQLENIVEDKFVGENAVLGADTDSVGYVKEKGRHSLLSYTVSKLDEAYKLIKSGEIVPASSDNEMTSDNFIGLGKNNKINN